MEKPQFEYIASFFVVMTSKTGYRVTQILVAALQGSLGKEKDVNDSVNKYEGEMVRNAMGTQYQLGHRYKKDQALRVVFGIDAEYVDDTKGELAIHTTAINIELLPYEEQLMFKEVDDEISREKMQKGTH